MNDFLLNNFLNLVFTTGIFGGVALIFRNSFSRFFTKGIETNFDKKLEAAKSEFRSSEDALKSKLNAKNEEISQMRSNILSIQKGRSELLIQKQIESAEIILKCAFEISKLEMCAETFKAMDFQKCLARSDDVKINEYFKVLSNTFKIDEATKTINAIDVGISQLYIPPKAWTAFKVYRLIIINAAMKIKYLSLGISDPDILKQDVLSKAVSAAFPEIKDGFEKFGDEFAYHWTKYVFNKLIEELRLTVDGNAEMQNEMQKSIELTNALSPELRKFKDQIPKEILKD